MYSVRLGYSDAIVRIQRLLQNGHTAEALVTSVFTAEKTLRRTLRQLVISAGFPSVAADRIIRKLNGIDAVKDAWDLYDPKQRKLSILLQPNDWQVIHHASMMRNKLVHGERVFNVVECRQNADAVLAALANIKTVFDTEYAYSGWTKARARKISRLHADPKVQITP